MSIAETRQELIDAFKGLNVNVYQQVPPVVMPPALFVFPDDPYLEPVTIGSRLRFQANFRIGAAVAYNDTPAALANLETLMVDVLSALPVGEAGSWEKPTQDQVGPSNLLVSQITFKVNTEEYR